MKRYVKELANDILSVKAYRLRGVEMRHPGADEIERLLRHCERGRISDLEAVKEIIAIDERHKGESWYVV